MNSDTSILAIGLIAAGVAAAYLRSSYLGLLLCAVAVVVALSLKMANVCAGLAERACGPGHA